MNKMLLVHVALGTICSAVQTSNHPDVHISEHDSGHEGNVFPGVFYTISRAFRRPFGWCREPCNSTKSEDSDRAHQNGQNKKKATAKYKVGDRVSIDGGLGTIALVS